MECGWYAQNPPYDSSPGNPETLAYAKINWAEGGVEPRHHDQALLYSLQEWEHEGTTYWT